MPNLYQTYRPKTFKEVVGHKKEVQELLKRSQSNSIPQVMYLVGGTGTGKTTLARIIAKAVTCENKVDGEPCNTCNYCQDVNEEQFIRASYEYNASNFDIETSRKVEEIVSRSSLLSPVKVIFIDELQELHANKKAQKNLLKILENVNKDTYFILGAMDDSKVDKAIKGRAVTYNLKPLGVEEIARYLHVIAKKEGVELKEKQEINTLLAIAENCGGSMRNAIAYLERAVFSGIWDEKELLNELGIVSSDSLQVIIQKILAGDFTAVDGKITQEIVEKIRQYFVVLLKKKNGIEIEYWQDTYRINPKNIPIEAISQSLEKLFDLNKYVWLSQDLIDYTLLEAIRFNNLYNKGLEIPTEVLERKPVVPAAPAEEPKRRRRVAEEE